MQQRLLAAPLRKGSIGGHSQDAIFEGDVQSACLEQAYTSRLKRPPISVVRNAYRDYSLAAIVVYASAERVLSGLLLRGYSKPTL